MSDKETKPWSTKRDDEASRTQGALQECGSDGAVCSPPVQDTPLTLQCEGGQANTYILHANTISVNVSDCQVVQLGDNNKVFIDNPSSDELTLTVTHREPNAGELIPNGQSRTRALDKKTDASVEVAVLRGGRQDRRVLEPGPAAEYEVSVSVVRQPLSETESDVWTAESACTWEMVKAVHAGTRLFLFRLFGPKAKFEVTFTLECRRMSTPSKYDYLYRQETFWDPVCQTTVLLENTGERKKFRKARLGKTTTKNGAGVGGDLATDCLRGGGHRGSSAQKQKSSKNLQRQSSSGGEMYGQGESQGLQGQALFSADLTTGGPSPVLSARYGNKSKTAKPHWDSMRDSSDEENHFGQRMPMPHILGGLSGDIVSDLLSPAIISTQYGDTTQNKKLFKNSKRGSSDQQNQIGQRTLHSRRGLSGDIVTDSALPTVKMCYDSEVRKPKSPRSSLEDSSDEEDSPRHGGRQGSARGSRGSVSGDVFSDGPLRAMIPLNGNTFNKEKPHRVNRQLFFDQEEENGSDFRKQKPNRVNRRLFFDQEEGLPAPNPMLSGHIEDDCPKQRLPNKHLDGSVDDGATSSCAKLEYNRIQGTGTEYCMGMLGDMGIASPSPSQTQVGTPAIPLDMDASSWRSVGGHHDDDTNEDPNLDRVVDEIPTGNPRNENSVQQLGAVNAGRQELVTYGMRMEEERVVRSRLPLVNLKGQCNTKKYGLIMRKLAMLQDNGEWEVFDRLSQDLLNSLGQGKKDFKCVITIEQGVKQYYRNQLDQAIQTFQGVIQLTDRTDNPELLRGRTYFLMANVYRELKLLGLAEQCLALSEQNLQQVKSNEDKAEFYYYCGNFLTECLNMMPKPSREMIRKAKECFRKELDIASQTPDKRVRLKKMQYALLKIAFLLLDCRNGLGRTRKVSPEDVQEAKECLDKIENELWYNVPMGTEIQFTLARSDQFYRQGNHARALDLARAALDNITRGEFNTQKEKAKDRIKHLTRLVQEDTADVMTPESLLAVVCEPSEGDMASGDTEGQESGVDVHDPNFAL